MRSQAGQNVVGEIWLAQQLACSITLPWSGNPKLLDSIHTILAPNSLDRQPGQPLFPRTFKTIYSEFAVRSAKWLRAAAEMIFRVCWKLGYFILVHRSDSVTMTISILNLYEAPHDPVAPAKGTVRHGYTLTRSKKTGPKLSTAKQLYYTVWIGRVHQQLPTEFQNMEWPQNLVAQPVPRAASRSLSGLQSCHLTLNPPTNSFAAAPPTAAVPALQFARRHHCLPGAQASGLPIRSIVNEYHGINELHSVDRGLKKEEEEGRAWPHPACASILTLSHAIDLCAIDTPLAVLAGTFLSFGRQRRRRLHLLLPEAPAARRRPP
ncbi:hypothetical protein B0H14DRAFT_2604146 [Mycena olivaceomarginata]|nr:hypothetical protein B0H14DRAFT_2604146 [Mycena olivaceomarginata]